MDLPHPTALSRPRSEFQADFLRVTQDRCKDPIWHFRVGVHRASKLAPDGETPPTAEAPIQSLALFHRDEPAFDIEVFGVHLDREIDPADWLDDWLALQGHEIVSKKPVRMLAGVVGDDVTRWKVEGDEHAGRFFATKWGPRLFVLACRAPIAVYPRIAEDFFVSIMTFEVLDDSLGLFAEKGRTVSDATPIPWKTFVPGSWTVQPEPPGERVASFQASLTPPPAVEYALGQEALLGKLSFAVIARGAAKRPRDVAKAFLDAVREAGIEIESDKFEEEPAKAPFEKSWLLVSKAKREGTAGEVRCRVMLHPHAWVVGGVVGPAREDAALVWMQNKRTLDVVTSTLEMKASR